VTAEDVADVSLDWCTDDDISYEEEQKHGSGGLFQGSKYFFQGVNSGEISYYHLETKAPCPRCRRP